MRRLVVFGSVVALGVVLVGCSGEVADQPDADQSTVASTPTEPTSAETPGPEPVAPVSPEPDERSLDATFAAMLEAVEEDGEQGLRPFLASPDAGDVWHLSDWDWTGGPCAEGGPGESACVGYFVKDGMELENIFGFENVDGQWLLVESWVAGE